MSLRLHAVLACVLLAPAARPVLADDELLERVERALAAAREREAPPDVAQLLNGLERRAQQRQAEFDAASARPLPPKARERLEATRRAWAAGQGRLLEGLRALQPDRAQAPRPVGRKREAKLRSVDKDEMLRLLRRLRAASRPEPLSDGELKTRIPALAPATPALSPVTHVAPGEEPPIGTIAPEVRQKAASFSGPIEAYEWVRHAIRPELYHGVMKGPLQTLLEASGNDADTAGLLIALLRARGIPARYVRGTVEIGAALAVAITGTSTPERALRAFTRAGVPTEPVAGPGGLAAIRVERVWAEAYVPYANYRGAILDAFEKTWVPLDAGLKRLDVPGGYDVRSVGFDPLQTFDDYLTAPPALAPREFFRQRAVAALAQARPDLTYEQALARRDIVAQNLGLLPASLPYTVAARAEVGYAPPAPLVHTARFQVAANGTTLLDASFDVPALLGQRLTLSYVPFEADDEEVVRQYGGLFATPPYLVDVKPVLKLGGVVLASGSAGAGLGTKLDLHIELATPGGSDVVENRVIAGNLTAIGLAAGQVTTDESRQDEAARVLARLAFRYLDRWNQSDAELAALLRVVAIRPTVATCLVQSAVAVEYAGGDPLYPVSYEWKGLAIDADRHPSAPVGIENDAAERDFLLASGLEGSVLEHRLFEDELGIASVSTAKALQLAAQQGTAVLDLGPENADSVLPGLPLDEGVKAEIQQAAASGYRIRVPAAPLSLRAWTGTGYLVFDPETGESAWQLQGGHSGGVTVPAVVELPAELVDTVARQSESPAPRPGDVAFIQKFDTTDFQLGTVDTPLPKSFKVLVTDEAGFPAPGAPVTWSVIGGGGTLVDPATGRASASEITVLSCAGGETVEPCRSLKPGEAVATLRLGKRTGEIPFFTCEEPFTCTCPVGEACDRERVGYTTQIGMNLVTVRSGSAEVSEPFTSFGYPERPPAPGVPGAILVFVRLAKPPVYNLVNLTVVDRMALAVEDRHGNPISNVRMSVSFEGPPKLSTPVPGVSLMRPATTTPGHVLRERDYARCLETTPSVVWGQCPGEAESVVVASSSRGASVYPVLGDSPSSYYRFNFGTTLNPAIGWVRYLTNGFYCPKPEPSACKAWDAPQTLVWQGTRPVFSNLQGNVVEAYPPGGGAEVGLWADVVYEEARVTRTVDADGGEHFRAFGANVWRRERLTDSELRLRPLTPGTGVAATAPHVGDGRYTAPMTLAPDPRLNSVEVVGKHYAPLVKYLGPTGGDVDPATVDRATLALTRVKDPARPVQIVDQFDLWGVEPKITELVPSPVFLGASGLVSRASTVVYQVRPPEYRALLAPNDLRFQVTAEDDKVVLQATGAETPTFRIPAGLALPPGDYNARLNVLGVTGGGVGIGANLSSPPFPLPICSLLDLETPIVEVNLTRDPVNGTLCEHGDKNRIRFRLCRSARVTLTVAGAPFTASLDGDTPRALADLTLGPGLHQVIVPAGLPELEPFRVEARDLEDATQTSVADGVIRSSVVNRAVLPVGHTFVKGVDLSDGHLVQQSTDFKLPGRHFGLELTRTYSSAGSSSAGPLGGGWSLNYTSRLFTDGGCGLVTVVTADGSSQVFRSTDGLVSFTPQKGYHTRLERDGSVYSFIDKAGNVHHFESPDADGRPRLDFIEEPHGDRLVFSYDGTSRLTKVAEVQEEAGELRAVTFAYQSIYGSDRVVRAEIAALGLAVDYEYDARGNLTKVTRNGVNLAGAETAATAPRVEQYRYRSLPPGPGGRPPASDLRKQHQLVEVTDPNGNRREYVYYAEGDRLPGEVEGTSGGFLFTQKWELVKQVLEHPAPALTHRTEFLYDLSHFPQAELWTTVRDGRGKDALYVLNGNGSPLRILEPLGKTTTMVWAADDILKTSERDANGRLTEFGYDTRGNLTLERVLTSDLGPVATEYRYDPRFNKLTFKKDAEGRETNYSIDADSGDLIEMLDAVGNRTRYAYDGHGRLLSATDPRGHTTTHRGHDSYGNAGEVTDPLGNVTTRTFDLRGRLTRQTDTMGHDAQQAWDGLDRLVRTLRTAGGESDDEVQETTYYPGGEVRLTRNANGAETTYTIDGLSRVVATETRFDAETLTTATSWDANGNIDSTTDRRGVTRKNTHDALNRLTRVEIVTGVSGEGPIGQVAAYGYDLAGNKTSDTDVNGLVTGFEYDGLYQLEKKVLPVVNTATSTNYEELYLHDKVGNLRRVTDPNGKVTETEYDNLNRVKKVTRDLGGLNLVTTASYDDPEGSHVNKSEEKDVAKGLRTTFTYDALGRELVRSARLEGEDGDPAPNPGPYTTTSVYEDGDHAVRITDPRGVKALRMLDGLDRVFEETVDTAGLGPAAPLSLITTIEYDGLGNKKEVTDPEGRTTRFDYDGLGRLLKTTDAKGQESSATYFGDGLKASETDRRGMKKLFTYDNLGRARKTALDNSPFSGKPWSHETQSVDAVQPKRIEIDARSKRTTFDLDGLGRVTKETDHLANFRSFTWDGVNKLAETDKRRNETLFEYDGVNRLKKTTDPDPFDAQTVETTYEDAQNRVTTKDRKGNLTRTQADPLGRVVSVTRAFGTPEAAVLERNVYDPSGNKTLATDAEGKKARFEYDAANRLTLREDGFESASASVTTFPLYDKAGNLLEERDARAAALGEPWSLKRSYDDLNRLETETNGESLITTTYGYDPEGNRTSVTTPKVTLTSFEYDELGKLLKVTQPSVALAGGGRTSPTTTYGYDPSRNRIRQTDANGHVVAMEYDDLNRLKKTTQDPGGLELVTETVRFDANGNPEVVKDAKGQTITNTYDELNRLKAKSYAFAPGDTTRPWRYTASVDYGYDSNGNLKTTDEHVASGTSPPDTTLTTSRTYDGLDRLTSETSELPDGTTRTVSYSYYKNGLRKTVTDPAGSATQYAYDGQNRLETAVTGFGTGDAKTTSHSYWPDDLLKAVSYPNGVVATHGYDKADRLLTLQNAKGTTPVSSYTYSYDPNGNRVSQVEVNGGQTETTGYGYDDLDRLQTITYPVDAAYPQGRVVTYGYDAVGNRIRETEKDSADALLADKQGVFDNANRLSELQDLVTPAASTSFTWDPNGNQLSKTTAGVTTENRYDLRDKLVEVVQGASTLGRFQYDSEGRRNLKIGEEGLRQYVYDQTSLFTEYDSGGLQKAKYDYGSDRLISLTRTDEGRRYFSLDGLRSVVNLTDDPPSGQEVSVVASYHLDAWGNFRFPTELNDSKNRFAFTGHIFDTETGLYNAKARYFDPKLGRFLTQDSFLGTQDNPPSLHRYFYAAQNPTKYVDPTGHEFTLNPDKKYGPNEVPRPVLSGTVTREEYQQYLGYVEKHGSRDQVVAATLGAAGTYSTAYAQKIAKMEVAGVAGVAAAAPVAIAGGGVVAVGAVAGGTQGFVEGLLDQASATELAVRTATGAALGAAIGWAAQRIGAFIAGEASPSVPGAGKTNSIAMKQVSGEPPPVAASVEGASKPPDYDRAAWAAYHRAHPEQMRSVGAAGAKPEPPAVTRKIPSEKLKLAPKQRGRAPIGEDDKPVELHHTEQELGNESPRAEMTRTEHRGEGSFAENHPNTGQKPSAVDRTESRRQHRAHWQREWDEGRFEDLPKKQ